jgi:hypothetical protein
MRAREMFMAIFFIKSSTCKFVEAASCQGSIQLDEAVPDSRIYPIWAKILLHYITTLITFLTNEMVDAALKDQLDAAVPTANCAHQTLR